MAGGLSRGDVFLCSFPAPDKDRPVLILTRDAAISHLNTVTVSPVTSTIRVVPSEVRLDVDDGTKGPLRGKLPQYRFCVSKKTDQEGWPCEFASNG